MHWPLESQTFGGAQSSSEAHVVRHVPPLSQLNGAQSVTLPPDEVMTLPEQTPPDAAHTPALHEYPVAQSASTMHVVLHAVAPHA